MFISSESLQWVEFWGRPIALPKPLPYQAPPGSRLRSQVIPNAWPTASATLHICYRGCKNKVPYLLRSAVVYDISPSIARISTTSPSSVAAESAVNGGCPRMMFLLAIASILHRKWRDDGTLECINSISIIFASARDKQFIRVYQHLCGYHVAGDHEILAAWRLLCVQKN